MGVDLYGHGGASFTWAGWEDCLAVAQAFGWKPAGTAAPDPRKWDDVPVITGWNGTYFTNDYQEVTDADARALSLALNRALATLSTGQTLTEEQTEVLRGISGNELRRLADYAATGGFAIT
jgi:hypothetical protein